MRPYMKLFWYCLYRRAIDYPTSTFHKYQGQEGKHGDTTVTRFLCRWRADRANSNTAFAVWGALQICLQGGSRSVPLALLIDSCKALTDKYARRGIVNWIRNFDPIEFK